MLLHEGLTRIILGSFFEVHRELGSGFLESVYESALAKVLEERGIEARRQVPVAVIFRGAAIGVFRADLVVDGRIVLELKAVKRIDRAHEAQLLNYLRASALPVGLILNFGQRATFQRMVGPIAREVQRSEGR